MKVLMIGPRLDVKGGVSSVTRMIIQEERSDFEIIFRPSMNDKSLIGRIYHFISRILLFPYERLIIRPDVVHIHFSHSLSTWRKSVLSSIWRLSGKPVLMHAHSSDYKEYLPSLLRPFRRIAINSVKKSDALLVLSESWKIFYSESCDVGFEKIHVMENPIEVNTNSATKEELVLFSGRVGDRKGAFKLIEAWSKISSEERGGWKLVLTGDGEISKARRMVEELAVSESADVLGWVEENELLKLMSSCSIFVLPSRNEGLPMSLLEAMAQGAAVIATPVGGIPEVVEDGVNGLLIGVNDVEELSMSLKTLIADNSHRKTLGSNAKSSTEHLDINNYMRKMEEIWVSLLRRPS
jgi:glycosyltransferase involved in cell wall biosynthesis